MIALTTMRHRGTGPLAAALLAIQGLAGGAVPLAHASEHFSAPAHIEAQHDAGCLALHDELRCALCHYAASQVVSQEIRTAPSATSETERRWAWAAVVPTGTPRHLTAPPRAPPASPS